MLEIKCVFSTLAARSEFDRRICLTRDDRTKTGHRNMAQSIPSVHIPLRAFVGHLSFCFGKATKATIDRTIHKVYITFQISRGVFLGLSAIFSHFVKRG